MKLLVVEDAEDNIDLFKSTFSTDPTIQATYAKSRDSAIAAIRGASFDLVVLDLIIPTVDSALDGDPHHGLVVHSEIVNSLGIIPIFIFSGCDAPAIFKRFLSASDHCDFWGLGQPEAHIQFFEKNEFDKCLEAINRASNELRALNLIEVSVGPVVIPLSDYEKRVFRIFARLYHCSMVRISKLGGGLSDARTFKVEIQDDTFATQSRAVAKIGTIKLLEGENSGYDRHVKPILGVGCFPPLIQFIKAGAGLYGGLFYTLASDHVSTLHDLLKTNPVRAIPVADKLRRLLKPWHAGNSKLVPVSKIRSNLVNDDTLKQHASKFAFDWRAVEAIEVRILECPQHCDLHGLNVLLSDSDEPLLIDFGDVRPAPSSIDPIIMELSLLFHPNYASAWGDWPTVDQANHWDDLDTYLINCSVADFIKFCRNWASQDSGGDLGLYATAWAFALRQLKFPVFSILKATPNTNHELAIAVANACARRLSPQPKRCLSPFPIYFIYVSFVL
jgi:CheY-like chemotaxis protein